MCYKLSRSPALLHILAGYPAAELAAVGSETGGGKGRMAPRGRQVTCYGAAVLLAAALLLSAPDATGSTRSLPPPPSLSCLVLLEPREWQVDRRGRMARGARGSGGAMANGRSPFGVGVRTVSWPMRIRNRNHFCCNPRSCRPRLTSAAVPLSAEKSCCELLHAELLASLMLYLFLELGIRVHSSLLSRVPQQVFFFTLY